MTGSAYTALAQALAAEARASIARQRQRDALRPIGAEAIDMGQADLRRRPDPSIDAADWGVFRVRWNGREWRRVKRLSAGLTIGEALTRASEWSARLALPRRENAP